MPYNEARDSVLPEQRTTLEVAFEAIGFERYEAIVASFGNLLDPATCPAALLPWLAWSLGMDIWDPNWTEEQMRDAILRHGSVMRRRGTKQSLKDAIAPWGATLEVVEWWEPGALNTTPYTFVVRVTEGQATLAAIRTAIDRTKPARAHYTLEPGVGGLTTVGVGAVVRPAVLATMSATI